MIAFVSTAFVSTAFVLHYALNALWLVPVLTLTCALVIRILRPGLLAAHSLWIATLLLAVAMPLRGYQSAMPQTRIAPRTSVAESADIDLDLPVVSSNAPVLREYVLAIPTRWEFPLLALYLLTVAMAVARLLIAALRARELVASSTPACFDPQQTHLLADLAARFAVSPPPVRLPADAQTGPLLTGIRAPTIVLLESLTAVAPEHLEAALAHELAHLRRHDILINLALQIASIPIAFHPASLLLDRRIRQTRELLTDRLAASVLVSPEAYARSLIALSAHLLPRAIPPLAAGLFPHFHPHVHPHAQPHAQPHALEERIMTLIVAPTPKAHPVVRAARLAGAVSLCLGTLTAASLLHVTPAVQAAQQAPSEPSIAAAPATSAVAPTPQTVITHDGDSTTTTTTSIAPHSTTREIYTRSGSASLAPAPQIPQTPIIPNSTQPDSSNQGSIQHDPAVPQPPTPPAPPSSMPQSFVIDLPNDEKNPKSFVVAIPKIDMDMSKLSVKVDPKMLASIEAMRKQIDSPAFRKQIDAATSAAANVRVTFTPDELRQMAEVERVNSDARTALREAFHLRIDEAKRKFREQVRGAANDPKQIDKFTHEFTDEIQAATAQYTAGLTTTTHQ